MKGYIQISRGLFDHWIWKERREYSRAEAWIDLIRTATYRDETAFFQGRCLNLQRGELLASGRYLENRWDWSRSKVDRFLAVLAKEGMVERRVEQGMSIVTVCNYDRYNTTRATDEATDEARGEPGASQRRAKSNKGKELKESEELGESAAAPAPRSKKDERADIPLMLATLPDFGKWWEAYILMCQRRKPAWAIAASNQELILNRLLGEPDPLATLKDAVEQSLQVAWVIERRTKHVNGHRPGNGMIKSDPNVQEVKYL